MIYVRCALGIHGYDIQDETVIRTETWHKVNGYGEKIKNSNYIREVIVTIEKCRRCGRTVAHRHMTNPDQGYETLSVEFAQAEINRARSKSK